MGTEVLLPRDCLIERIRVSPVVNPRRRSFYNNHKQNRTKPAVRTDQRKKAYQSEPAATMFLERSTTDDLKRSKNFGMGQIKILRRGDSLDSGINSELLNNKDNCGDPIVSGMGRLGLDQEMVPKQIQILELNPKSLFSPVSGIRDVYAGSAFAMSPSPESLPLPSFSKKKQVSVIVDDSATRDLRRLLRLD
ncbi:hypothetical protein Nepgr_021869 [Nepenthes gracilis]|uniref:Uncharacterized protein n=1 Tax=Nepenthes gracilis TaxID=150966 RepID=A0AAD3SXK0_NEPGR|nr:hypothetical protein Nepgr_021869 [Nepenthes gracilis]